MFTSIVVPGTKDGLNYLKVGLVSNFTILPDTRITVIERCLGCRSDPMKTILLPHCMLPRCKCSSS